jgi:uncharacterized membrane protein YfcA
MMEMSLLFIAAFIAGAMNAVAGGGTLLAFPALLFMGVPSIIANATCSLALWPSSLASALVYRKQIEAPKRSVLLMIVISVIGGWIGARLLLFTSQRVFDELVPWLLFFATVLLTISGRVQDLAQKSTLHHSHLWTITMVGQFFISIYGGYFGAGMGVLMLALFSSAMVSPIHSMIGIRSVCGAAIYGMAILVFVTGNTIDWPRGLVMCVGAILGSYLCAVTMRRTDAKGVKRVMIAVSWLMTFIFIARSHLAVQFMKRLIPPLH